MLTPAPREYALQLTVLADGPHDDVTTAGVAQIVAEAVRFLNYAVTRGGITEPATIYTVTGELTSAAYRLPQLLSQLGEWLTTEARAGRIADDHGRPTWQLADQIGAELAEASGHADRLNTTLAAVQSLTSSLHSTGRGDDR
jgi:hypothetical protein